MYSASQVKAILELCADDPFYFGKVVAGNYFSNEFAVFHRHMLRKINNLPKHIKIIVIEVPRGYAKTMLASTLNPLHRAIFATRPEKRTKYIVIGSCSNTKAKQIISDYRNIVMGDNFQGVLPNTVLNKDREDLLEIYNSDLGFHFQVMARGRDSQVVGLRFLENRPDMAIMDDLEDPDESYNQDIVDHNVNYIDEAVIPGLAPNGIVVLIGTPFATDCFTERFAKRSRGVVVIKYPALVETEDMANELGLQIGQSIWEDRYPTVEVERERDDAFANGTIDGWMRQFMLNPVSDSQVRFNMNKIHRIEPEQIENIKMNIFILSDYAYSKHIHADESAIITLGVDDQANYYILYSDKGKWGDIGTTERIIDQVRKYHKDLCSVGVEAKGLGFIERRLMEVKREENFNFGVIELKPENRPKPMRIKGMISVVEDGRIFFVGKHQKLEVELQSFRGEDVKRGDDLRDTFAYIRDVAYKPITSKTREEQLREQQHKEFVEFGNEFKRSKEQDQTRRVRSVNEDRYY